jgi:peptidoglycan LD-endopeptidase LytH
MKVKPNYASARRRRRFLLQSAIGLFGLALLACAPTSPANEPVPPTATPRETVSPPAPLPTITPHRLPTPTVTPTLESPSPLPFVTPAPLPNALSLVIPVVGIRREQLHDTFNEARSEGRVHEAIDILAPQGSKVVAAAAGTIVKLFTSAKGGITIYQRSTDEQLVFYYAHLDRYAEGLAEKQEVRQGDVIGYVGDTGNAQPGNYHLHFAIWQPTNPKDFWNGTNLNPYDMLRRAPGSH